MCLCSCIRDIKKCYTNSDEAINIPLKYAIITSIATAIIGTISMPFYMYYNDQTYHHDFSDGRIVGGAIILSLFAEASFLATGAIWGVAIATIKQSYIEWKNRDTYLPI
jgi:hypothetical protein